MILKVIIDGLDYNYTGFKMADTPYLDKFLAKSNYSILKASGESVGLNKNMQGNKKSGLLTLGCGRTIYRNDIYILKSISNKSFYKNPALVGFVSFIKNNFHLVVSLLNNDSIKYIKAIISVLKRFKKKNLFIHVVLEGDSKNPQNAEKILIELSECLEKSRIGKIATISGAYYAFDTEQRWERTILYFKALTEGIGYKAKNVFEAVRNAYKRNETDQFIKPSIIINNHLEPLCQLKNDDGIIWSEFEPLKIVQIIRALKEREFSGFTRNINIETSDLAFCQLPVEMRVSTVYPEKDIQNTLTELVSTAGIRQVKLSESIEMAEFIYYFNGKSERLFFNEDRISVPSPDSPSFTSVPEMSSYLLTDKCIEVIKKGIKEFIILNFINFGIMQKLAMTENQIKALEIIDQCIGLLYENINKKRDSMIITAVYPSQVPFILIKDGKYKLSKKGELKDATATILEILGIEQPEIMTGKSLIIEK